MQSDPIGLAGGARVRSCGHSYRAVHCPAQWSVGVDLNLGVVNSRMASKTCWSCTRAMRVKEPCRIARRLGTGVLHTKSR